MAHSLHLETERFPIAGSFRISRGSKTEAEVITCTIRQGDHAGRGECVPYGRYGETVANVLDAVEAVRGDIERGLSREELLSAMRPGAARNAVDCALWDLEAKSLGHNTHMRVCRVLPRPVVTAFTISLGDPEEMAGQARAAADRPAQPPAQDRVADLTALIVENDAEMTLALSQLLEQWGIDVLDVSSGEDAIALIEETGVEPDLCLVDYQLGSGMDGIACLTGLAGLLPATSVQCLMTANRSDALQQEAASRSIQILHKPISPATLARAIMPAIGNDRQASLPIDIAD